MTPSRPAHSLMKELVGFIARARTAADRRMANRIATVLILVEPSLVPLLSLFAAGDARVDVPMLARLYWNSNGGARVALASASALRYLPARKFRRIWADALGRVTNVPQKAWLGRSLAAHLARNEGAYDRFEVDVLRHYVNVRDLDLRVRGFEVLGYANEATPALMEFFRGGFASRSPVVRMAALYGFSILARRLSRISPSQRSAVVTLRAAILARASDDGDADVRLGARNCLAALDASARRLTRPPKAPSQSRARSK